MLHNKDHLILWEEYIKTHFNNQREEIITNAKNKTKLSISKEEVKALIKSYKDGKFPDDLTANVRMLLKRYSLDVNQNIFSCFIDYFKAFHKEKHEQLEH